MSDLLNLNHYDLIVNPSSGIFSLVTAPRHLHVFLYNTVSATIWTISTSTFTKPRPHDYRILYPALHNRMHSSSLFLLLFPHYNTPQDRYRQQQYCTTTPCFTPSDARMRSRLGLVRQYNLFMLWIGSLLAAALDGCLDYAQV